MKLAKLFRRAFPKRTSKIVSAEKAAYWAAKKAQADFQRARSEALAKHPQRSLILLERNAKSKRDSLAFFAAKARR